jgi:hypothetical protein
VVEESVAGDLEGRKKRSEIQQREEKRKERRGERGEEDRRGEDRRGQERRGEERKERGRKKERGREGPSATPTSSIIYGVTKLMAKYRQLPNDLEPLRCG